MTTTKKPKNIQEATEMGLTIHREKAFDKGLWADRMTPNYLNCTVPTEGDACAESACVAGKQRIYFCTDGQCAYRYVIIDC
jgi:hypothetical protein